MRRPRKPTPLTLRDITYNPITGLYSRSQDGITYEFPLELTRHLKEYFRHYDQGIGGKPNYPTMAKWYSDLSREEKKQVVRTGNVPPEKQDFFPDPEYE